MSDVPRVFRLLAVTAAVATLSPTLGCLAGQPGEPAPAAASAPVNIRSFAPKESSTVVDAEDINLRTVFEELGPDATLWYQHVQTLANPFFEGRAPGTRGAELAAEYIEFYFRSYGLQPAFPADEEQLGGETDAALVSYRQPFGFSVRSPRAHVEVMEAALSVNGESLADGEDFVVLGNSGTGEVTAALSFVGYGIADGPDEYSSFDDDTDLSGRIALLLRYEPLDEEGNSQWSTERFSRQAAIFRKMRSVAERGAAGILLVNPPGAVQGRRGLEPIERSRLFGRGLDVPAMHITPELADRLLHEADPLGRDLMTWRRLADTGDVQTVHLSDAVQLSMAGAVERRRERREFASENVGGILRGKGESAEQWIVIGGHYDHVGYGYFGTDPSNGQVNPGADDNASGTAGVLILARNLAETYAEADDRANLRSILFLAFSAEESGLHGSRYYVDHSTIAPEAVTAMVNLDMIGRLRSKELMVSGTGTAEEFDALLAPHFEQSGLTIATSPGGRGPSDHSNFFGAGIPVLFMFTGMHPEYTSPRDQAYTVNPGGAAKVLDLVHGIVTELATRPQMLTFARPAGAPSERRGYAGVRLGITPAFGDQQETGVLVDDVSEGGSAAEAGIQPGDIIVAWNGVELDGLAAMVDQMRTHKPGDVVTITIRRDNQNIDLEVKLKAGERRE